MLDPAHLLIEHMSLFTERVLPGPILDLACGDGRNGIFLAQQGLSVICCDNSSERLQRAQELALENGAGIILWQVDLEAPSASPLPPDSYGALLVFRYLHRPLISCIRKALRPTGILMYETYTVEQAKFGKPRNPDFLLKPGELKGWFEDWNILHYWEGIEEEKERAIAQLVCTKPPAGQ